MTDHQAIDVARFNARLHHLLETDSDTMLDQKELMIYIREALSQQATDIRVERKILEKELQVLERQLRPLDQIKA